MARRWGCTSVDPVASKFGTSVASWAIRLAYPQIAAELRPEVKLRRILGALPGERRPSAERFARQIVSKTDSILDELVRSEFREILANEREAAIHAALKTLSMLPLNPGHLANLNIDSRSLLAALRRTDPNVRERAGLSEEGYNFYRLLLERVCVIIAETARREPAVLGAAHSETLIRIQRLEELVQETLTNKREKPATTATDSNTPRLTTGALPSLSHIFVGRADAKDDLRSHITAHDPAGITTAVHAVNGMPGVGKTTLVLLIAHERKEQYPGGVFFVDLHGHTRSILPMTPDAALEELLRQSGVSGANIPADLGRRQSRWRAEMASRQALVVLDNALDADQVAPLLPLSTSCLVLITSRSRLSGLPGVSHISLDKMSVSDARNMLVELIGIDRCHDDDSLTAVAELTGRLPLAIEMVAGRMRADTATTLSEVAEALSDAKTRLDETSPDQSGVRAAFEVSLQRLKRSERDAFQILGLYPGSAVGVPQFAALADLPLTEASRLLRILADRNLIRSIAGRFGYRQYELHDLLRDFAGEQAVMFLPTERRQTAIQNLTTWYVVALRKFSLLRSRASNLESATEPSELKLADHDDAREWLTFEQGNLRAYATVASGIQAGYVLNKSAESLLVLSYFAAAYDLANHAVRVSCELGDLFGEAYAQLTLGEASRLSGDAIAARSHFERAITISPQIPDWRGLPNALCGIGHLDRQAGDATLARRSFERALRAARRLEVSEGMASALFGLAELALEARHEGSVGADWRTSPAGKNYQLVLEICQKNGDEWGQAHAWLGLGQAASYASDVSSALDNYTNALRLCKKVGDRLGEASTLWELADVAAILKQTDRAHELQHEANFVYREIGYPPK